MGRKKKVVDSDAGISLKQETKHGVLVVVFGALAIFFILSAFNKAGVVGAKTYDWLSILLGVGYYILPTLSFILSIAYAKSFRTSFAKGRIFGAIIFFFASLGIIEILLPKDGGLLGYAISAPILKLFDLYASLILLFSLVIISLLIVFDTKPTLGFLTFWRKEKIDEDEEEGVIEITREEEEVAEAEEEKISSIFGIGKKETREEVVDESGIKSFKSHITGRDFSPPPLSLLEKDKGKPGVGDIKANSNIIKRTLQNFGIDVEMDEVSIGPSVTRYALKPAEGVKLSRILGLQNNLELALAAHPVRIEAPIPGKSLVGIEIPNSTKTTVGLATILSSSEYKDSGKALVVGLGKNISGKTIVGDLAKMPHLLIAGATGSGKSVAIHAIINSLLFRNSPENLRFIMIDPKRVELTQYNKTPHLLTPVITGAKQAILALKWAAKEMDRRYDILEAEAVRDIQSYHGNILAPALIKLKKKELQSGASLPESMPYIVIIIDELADIMQSYPRELESAVVRIAQMSRAVGIHLILSPQRPSVNIITGLIKANIPSRIALQVASQVDSRTILDASGAEKLLGAGDMLYMSGEMGKPQRLQSPYVSEDEVKRVVKYLKDNYEELGDVITLSDERDRGDIFSANLDDRLDDDDDLYEEAKETIKSAGRASTSYLQRKLKVGYARAARLMDMLEERGVIGPQEGSKPRDVLERNENGYESESGNYEEVEEDTDNSSEKDF